MDRYQQDAESAMVELIQLFVLCCGCKAGITVEMFQTEDPSDVIRALTENFAEVGSPAVSFVCGHEGVVSLLTGEWRLPSHIVWPHIQEVQSECLWQCVSGCH